MTTMLLLLLPLEVASGAFVAPDGETESGGGGGGIADHGTGDDSQRSRGEHWQRGRVADDDVYHRELLGFTGQDNYRRIRRQQIRPRPMQTRGYNVVAVPASRMQQQQQQTDPKLLQLQQQDELPPVASPSAATSKSPTEGEDQYEQLGYIPPGCFPISQYASPYGEDGDYGADIYDEDVFVAASTATTSGTATATTWKGEHDDVDDDDEKMRRRSLQWRRRVQQAVLLPSSEDHFRNREGSREEDPERKLKGSKGKGGSKSAGYYYHYAYPPITPTLPYYNNGTHNIYWHPGSPILPPGKGKGKGKGVVVQYPGKSKSKYGNGKSKSGKGTYYYCPPPGAFPPGPSIPSVPGSGVIVISVPSNLYQICQDANRRSECEEFCFLFLCCTFEPSAPTSCLAANRAQCQEIDRACSVLAEPMPTPPTPPPIAPPTIAPPAPTVSPPTPTVSPPTLTSPPSNPPSPPTAPPVSLPPTTPSTVPGLPTPGPTASSTTPQGCDWDSLNHEGGFTLIEFTTCPDLVANAGIEYVNTFWMRTVVL